MAKTTMDPVEMVRKTLEEGSPDVVRSMVQALAEAMMAAEADAMCGAGYGERSPSRTNHRNGYRERRWDTRVGTIDLAIPKLRQGSYYPDWLLEPRRRSEKALVAVIAEAYLKGVSTRKVEAVVQQMGSKASARARSASSAPPSTSRSRPFDRARSRPPHTRMCTSTRPT